MKRRRAPTEAEWGEFIVALVTLKHRAGHIGLWATMHAIDGAASVAGYEAASVMTRDGKRPPRKKGAKP